MQPLVSLGSPPTHLRLALMLDSCQCILGLRDMADPADQIFDALPVLSSNIASGSNASVRLESDQTLVIDLTGPSALLPTVTCVVAVWIVVHDNRDGAAWTSFPVYVQ